ncbi:dihydroneopterin aldolase family protein [Haloarchaeobius sp. DT45]|uniref:dihydroneopterin aldolase family protein n=1 Tax=Haloarchaeobius sp. DT45 TaxID=3446116 RepID=UPI003F6C14E7
MDPTDSETACFEAGIKFGTLYHQFAGTPVSPASAESLGRAMEEAIENQPHCADVRVTMRTDRIEAELAAQSAEYTEFTGRFADVEMTIEYEGTTVETSMSMEGDYPMMRVDSVTDD